MTRPPQTIDETHDPARESWVESANDPASDFPIQNLPFGIFEERSAESRAGAGRACVAIGDRLIDLPGLRDAGLLDDLPRAVLHAIGQDRLNALMARTPRERQALRRALVDLLSAGTRAPVDRLRAHLRAAEGVRMLVPASVGDYTDFYASIFHATRVGRLFRPDNPLLPNYKFVPIGYHGRASSIVASGAPVVRPRGQTRPDPASPPVFGPSARLDYELEVGLLIGAANVLGEPVPVERAEEHAFGLCLVNDWSARDVQQWEYQPLGPFLAKNFATTVSPWVVTLEASNLATLYWTFSQMIAHHTSNGCNLRTGDLLASGTVSGADAGTQGCLLESTAGGTSPLILPSGEKRRFLEDGDEVVLRGWCERPGFRRIGLGECRGIIVPAR
jgi:fumarylacetoacetase